MQYPTRDTAPIRIRDLMSHSAGFAEDNPWGDRQLAIPDAEMGRWLDKGLPFSTPPATAYEYSNYGFALLGRIVARVSGMSYRDYVERRILAPLEMKSSTLEPSAVPGRQCMPKATRGRVIPTPRSLNWRTDPSARWAVCSPPRATSPSMSRSCCQPGLRAMTTSVDPCGAARFAKCRSCGAAVA